MRTVAALCRELLPDRRTDGALLAAFTSDRSEDTFGELVRRHGPLVWNTCHRLLPGPADAEDAFQATFLVLVRQAGRLAGRDAVGPWLHRVAVLTARNVRRKNARRLARQRELPDAVPVAAPDSDLRADIDAALLALPARLRDPIILCHLQGFTRREAAERLGCPEGTLSSWLDRGLAKLRTRLRDLDPVRALGVPAVAVPLALSTGTVKAAVASGVAAAAVPPAVSSLVEGVLHMLWIKKATAATFALFAVFALGVGVGLGTRPGSTGVVAQDGRAQPGAVPKPKPESVPTAEPPADVLQTKEALQKELAAAADALRAEIERLAAAAKANPQGFRDTQALEAAAQKLARVLSALTESDAELKALKDKLTKPKADKAPPTPADDVAKKLAELQNQLARLAIERQRALVQSKDLERQLAELDAQTAALRRTAELLAAQAQRNKPSAAAADYLELTVSAKGNGAEYTIREVLAPPPGKLDKALGPIVTSDPAALAVLLKRTKADPNGPQEARILAAADTPNKLVLEAAGACKAAGFKVLTAEVTGADKGNKKPSPDAKPTDVSEDLRQLVEERRRMAELRERDRERQLEQLKRATEDLQRQLDEERRKKREPNPKP